MGYPKELKEKALKLSDEIGNKAAAESLNLSVKTIATWRLQRKKNQKQTDNISNSKSETTSIKTPNSQNEDQTCECSFKRGQIYYISKGFQVGNEMYTGRPAVIVSNDRLNSKLNIVEVVFLTTRTKCVAPEHIIIHSSNTTATAICEQITTIDKSRLQEYVGTCTQEEMELIDMAIIASLGLEQHIHEATDSNNKITKLEIQLESYKSIIDKFFEKALSK